MYDIVIRGGTIVDGSGAAPFVGDVAIKDGRVAAVGQVADGGTEEIDAAGLVVTPGFVDIHTHFDGQITWDPLLTPSSWHGVTTVVMGNCGVGFAPAAPNRHDWLIGLMEGVEDIPGTALSEGIRWNWETFPEYLDFVDGLPKAIDVGTQVPHGAVRAYVMGERGAKNEPANPEDIMEMRRIAREGLDAGALGVSTSRTIVHRAIDGENVPGTFAAEDELMGLAMAIKDSGQGVFELAPAGVTGDDILLPEREIDWMRRVGQEAGCPITFALVQFESDPELWKRQFELSEAAAEDGADLYPQVAARAPGVLIGLQTNHPFLYTPTFKALSGYEKRARGDNHLLRLTPLPDLVEQLHNPEVRARILAERPVAYQDIPFLDLRRAFPMEEPLDYEPAEDQSVGARAEAEGVDPFELFYDLMLEHDGKMMFFAPTLNYHDYNLDVVRTMLTHPRSALGLGDAGAHCGVICDASMPTFMLAHWSRDRDRGEQLPIEFVVRKITSDTASLYGLNDRGRLAPGMKGDVNVIDLQRLAVRMPELVYDLPAEGRRIVQRADGYVATIVSGSVILRDGEATGALPGRLVRGAQSAPA